MKNTHPNITFEIISNIITFVDTEQQRIEKQLEIIQQEMMEFEEHWEERDTQFYDQYGNIREYCRSCIDNIYIEANELYKIVEKKLKKAKISNKIMTLAKLKKNNDTFVDVKKFKLEILDDCIEAFEEIKKDYDSLEERYETDFSTYSDSIAALKKGEEHNIVGHLHALHGTIILFLDDLQKNGEAILHASVDEKRSEVLRLYEAEQNQKNQNSTELQNRQQQRIDALCESIRNNLDAVFPDELAKEYQTIWQKSDYMAKDINLSEQPAGDAVAVVKVLCPILNIRTGILKDVLQEKCGTLFYDNLLQIPLSIPVGNSPAWFFVNRNTEHSETIERVIHSLMIAGLSLFPVGGCSLTVIDPVKRGNSIAPFEKLRRTFPELFEHKIYIAQNEIKNKISEIYLNIEYILMEKLGSRYEDIYEYAKDYTEYHVDSKLLLLYDFPKGFDEETLGMLEMIIENGSKCGIYTFISCNGQKLDREDWSDKYVQKLEQIKNASLILQMDSNKLYCNNMTVAPFLYNEQFFDFFFGRFTLFYGSRTDKCVFPPMVNQMALSSDWSEVSTYLSRFQQMEEIYKSTYGKVANKENAFPEQMVLGQICYPENILACSKLSTQVVEQFGCAGTEKNETIIRLPWSIELKEGINFYLSCSMTNRQEAVAFSHHIIWSFLSFLPVSKLNICVFDNEQRGNSIIPFLDFRKQCPDIFGEKIYTGQEEMYQKLKKFNEKIDDFIQEKLGSRYQDFLEYNKNTPKCSEPATLLVIYDFPGGMDSRCLNELTSIIQNGNKCGIYTLICHNTEAVYSGYENLRERMERISENCVNVEYKEGKYKMCPYDIEIQIPHVPSSDKMQQFIAAYGEKMENVKKQGIYLSNILQEPFFEGDSADKLEIPIGVGEADKIVSLTMGERQSHHGLIAGATGSGKSTLLHTIIMSSMFRYSPDELQLYLMDFKSGTEFKIYDTQRLPHIRLLALDAMQEFGESILEELVKEMEKRGDAFKEAGGVTKIRDYVEVTGHKMPRILVVMDEFQILFNDATNRKVAMNCAKLTQRIVTEGRAYGIHLLMATQSTKVIMNLTLSTGTIEQMRIRLGLKCGDADARYMFGEENYGKALDMMKGATGTAVMNLDYTEKKNTELRVAYCSPEQQQEYLKNLSESLRDYPVATQVFEGKRTEKLLDSIGKNGQPAKELPLYIHMGIPIKVAPPYIVKLNKKPKNNLLICSGSQPNMANMISNDYLISAVMNEKVNVYCIDGNILLDDDYEREFYDVLSAYTSRFHLAENRGNIIEMIDEIYEKYKAFRKSRKNEEAIVVVIKNLDYLDIVGEMLRGETGNRDDYLEREAVGPEQNIEPDKQEEKEELSDVEKAFSEDLFSFLSSDEKDTGADTSEQEVGEELIEMMDRGSAYGIYFTISALDYQTIRENMIMGRNYEKEILKKFPNRIVYSLSDADAEALIPDVTVSGLADNTVYFTDGFQKKFQLKPFVAPTAEELKDFLKECND